MSDLVIPDDRVTLGQICKFITDSNLSLDTPIAIYSPQDGYRWFWNCTLNILVTDGHPPEMYDAYNYANTDGAPFDVAIWAHLKQTCRRVMSTTQAPPTSGVTPLTCDAMLKWLAEDRCPADTLVSSFKWEKPMYWVVKLECGKRLRDSNKASVALQGHKPMYSRLMWDAIQKGKDVLLLTLDKI